MAGMPPALRRATCRIRKTPHGREYRPGVGCKCMTTRRIGFAERKITSEITAIDPPRKWAIPGVDGPIRAIVTVTVDPP
jgi:hypothetical protein